MDVSKNRVFVSINLFFINMFILPSFYGRCTRRVHRLSNKKNPSPGGHGFLTWAVYRGCSKARFCSSDVLFGQMERLLLFGLF